MNIIINGMKTDTTARNVAELLREQGYEGKIIAVARNSVFVPKMEHTNTILNDGDDIEIVAPMQGG
jgi:sulfur carrier protein